jgi:NTP pyrophosphatase (non-canonical NTP hydrolase)
MTIKEAQKQVDEWIKEYGVRYFSELTNMAVLTEEVGELARVMARRYGEQSWKDTDPRGADNGCEAMGEEMADILWVLICLANQTGVDLTAEFEKSMDKKTRRDSLRHIENEKLLA